MVVLLSALIMTAQYTYLKYLTDERLGELCKLNFINVSELKIKEDRVAALSTLKVVNDPAFAKPSAASLSSVGSPAAAVAKSLHVSSESDDLECYLSAFERLGRHHNLPSNEWNIVLEPFLTGKAQRAFNLVHDFNKDNYDVVSTAIRNAYRLTPEAYRSKFRASHKLTTETFTEYAGRLALYLRRWLMPDNTLTNMKSFQRILDKIVVDQLLNAVHDEDIRLEIIKAGDSSLHDITELADDTMMHKNSLKKTTRSTPLNAAAPS